MFCEIDRAFFADLFNENKRKVSLDVVIYSVFCFAWGCDGCRQPDQTDTQLFSDSWIGLWPIFSAL